MSYDISYDYMINMIVQANMVKKDGFSLKYSLFIKSHNDKRW